MISLMPKDNSSLIFSDAIILNEFITLQRLSPSIRILSFSSKTLIP